jgi:hypothetical protein
MSEFPKADSNLDAFAPDSVRREWVPPAAKVYRMESTTENGGIYEVDTGELKEGS